MTRYTPAVFTVLGLLALAAAKPSLAQGYTYSGYMYDTVSISPTPNTDPTNVSPGYDPSTPKVYATTLVQESATVSVRYYITATWNGGQGTTPATISSEADCSVQGISTVYNGASYAYCTSSSGHSLSDSVTATSSRPSPPNYNDFLTLFVHGLSSNRIVLDCTLAADAYGDEGSSQATATLSFF